MVAAGLVAGTVVVGGGAAVASSQFGSGNDQKALVADAAQRLGVSSAQLTNALKQALNDRVDAAVAAGQLTKAQGDAIKARTAAMGVGAGVPFFMPGGGPGPGGFGFHVKAAFGPGGDILDAAATYLGVSTATLQADLQKGQSLADVANAQNKSTDGLKTALTNAMQTKLDAAVKSGAITQAQETDILNEFTSHVTDMINGAPLEVGPAFGFGFHRAGPLGAGIDDVFSAAASYLGVSTDTLKADLGKGQSLADVAKAQGKSTAGLKTAITDEAQTKLDAAVKNGDITKAQETEILSELSSHADDIINNTPTEIRIHVRSGSSLAPGSIPGPPAWIPSTPASSSTTTGTAA
jgi:hypothetical protein